MDTSCRGGGKRLDADSGEREVHKALAIKGRALGKGGESETPRGVPSKGEGRSRIFDNSSERVGTKGVSRAIQAIHSGVCYRPFIYIDAHNSPTQPSGR